jgi:hypothetical protein
MMPQETIPPILQVLVGSLSGAIVSSIISPLIFYYLNRKHHRREKAADRRIEDYRRYLQTLDSFGESLRNDFEDFLAVRFPAHISSLVAGNPNVDQFNRDLAQFPTRLFSNHARAKDELQGLQLTCSEEVLELVKPYLGLFESVQRDATIFPFELQQLAKAKDRLKELGAQSEVLHEKIMAQMRKEIAEC